jgi:hypothetical protein
MQSPPILVARERRASLQLDVLHLGRDAQLRHVFSIAPVEHPRRRTGVGTRQCLAPPHRSELDRDRDDVRRADGMLHAGRRAVEDEVAASRILETEVDGCCVAGGRRR